MQQSFEALVAVMTKCTVSPTAGAAGSIFSEMVIPLLTACQVPVASWVAFEGGLTDDGGEVGGTGGNGTVVAIGGMVGPGPVVVVADDGRWAGVVRTGAAGSEMAFGGGKVSVTRAVVGGGVRVVGTAGGAVEVVEPGRPDR